MKYYIIKQDKDYTDAPVITNWFGKIDADSIRLGKYKNLKKCIHCRQGTIKNCTRWT